MGSLVFQATLGGQVNLNGPNTASTFDIAVPATTGTMVTTGDSGTVTNTMLAASAYTTPGTIGSGTANTGAFTTLSASSTVSGTGFSTYLASPPAIGGTAAAAGTFTTLSGTTSVTTPIVKSASSLTLQTNGTTTAVTVDTSQNVGIGTTSPSTKLTTYQAGDGLHVKATNNTFYSAMGVSAGASAGYFDVASATNMLFTIGGSEKARFDSSGNFFVSANGSTNAGMSVNPSGYMGLGNTAGSSGFGFITFYRSGASIGSITQNGTTGVLYNLTSDYRLKNNQQLLTGAKDFIMALQPKKWQWWDGSGEGVGFVAHEFMEVAKYSGHGEKDAVDEDNKPVYQSIQPSSSEVMANLVAHIQNLETRLAALETK